MDEAERDESSKQSGDEWWQAMKWILALMAVMVLALPEVEAQSRPQGFVVAGATSGGTVATILVGADGSLSISSVQGTFAIASVGSSGSAVPGSLDYAGFKNASGNLQGATVTIFGSSSALDENLVNISAAATGQQTTANSDSITCASDSGHCVTTRVDGASHTQGVDPCQDDALTKANFNVRVATGSLTSLIAAQSSKTTYICWLKIEPDGTGETVSVVEAAHSSTACDGSQTALEGSTTAANGIALAANGGFGMGDGGYAMYKTSATNHEVCALDNSTNSVHYTGQWVAR